MTITTLYEDNHLLVAVKPPNIPCQADKSGDPDFLNALKADMKDRHNKPGKVYLGLVHRLDRPTGGVMVFARTSKAASRLSDQVRRHLFEKTYLAAVQGCPTPSQGLMTDYLYKDQETNTVTVCEEHTRGSRYAELAYTVLKQAGANSLVKVSLKTGRSHQIRVQFASRGTALLGDQRYNPDAQKEQLGLWASELSFQHPTTHEVLRFASDLPAEAPWLQFN
jgi:23S rRNA pseudouridine1911/1915/1917 synthase